MLDTWEKVVDAADEEERAELLNRMLAAAAAYPRMTNHVGTGWHLHYRDEGQSLGDVLYSLISVGTALHLAGRGMHRLRRCEVTECATIFADTSRTGRQRYCSPLRQPGRGPPPPGPRRVLGLADEGRTRDESINGNGFHILAARPVYDNHFHLA